MADMTAPSRKPLTGAALRQLVLELVSMGAAVKIRPDGTLEVTPGQVVGGDTSPFDLVDMKR